ncbi:MAG: DUF4349 domain-containing protein [Myxococcota bacterium]
MTFARTMGLALALVLARGAAAAAPEGSEPAEAEAPAPAPKAPIVDTLLAGSVVVAVSQQDAAAEALVAETRRLGGWFQSRTPAALSLRVPVDRFDALVAFAEAQGKVIDKELSRTDAGQELADLRSRLEARNSVLDEYYKVLRTARADAVVSVQLQIIAAISEIEAIEGRIRLLEDQSRNARLDVSFQFRDRAAPARDGTSSFPWLNTLNVQDVIAALQADKPRHRTRGATLDAPPDGLSAWRNRHRYRAASPDDVLFVLRSERHKPKSDLAFWKEAVRVRMVAAGYKVLGEGDVVANGVDGGLIDVAAPVGTEDWEYLIAFFPNGRRVVIAEAAGEVSALDARREAILAAFARIEP